MKGFAFSLVLLLSGHALADSRAGTNEWSLDLFIVGSKHYVFEGGASARNDGGAGIGLTVTRNLNDYFAVGLDATLSELEYRASVAPGAGNARAGVIFLDTNLATDPPANACWIYPWYGEVCSGKVPTTTLARLAYGVGAGLRFDLPHNQGFIRAFVSGEWIEIREALSPVGYVQFRTDWGIRF